jgi:hypothetical protein
VPGLTYVSVRRETGKERRVQVPCSEGVAIHTDLESCALHREVHGEALTKACGAVGQPSIHWTAANSTFMLRQIVGVQIRPLEVMMTIWVWEFEYSAH